MVQTQNSGCLQLIFPLSHEVQYSANDIMALIDKTILTGISDKQRKVFEWFTCYLTVLEEGIMSFISWAIVHRFPLGYRFNNVDENEQIILMVQKPTLLSVILLDTTPKVITLAESGQLYLSVWCQLVKQSNPLICFSRQRRWTRRSYCTAMYGAAKIERPFAVYLWQSIIFAAMGSSRSVSQIQLFLTLNLAF